MQYVIWILLAIFCLAPAITSIAILKHEDKFDKSGGDCK